MSPRQCLVVAGLALAAAGALLAWAAPAHAHTRGEETTNIDSRVTSQPAIDGVRWEVHTGGLLIEVENRSPEDLVVYGYADEPYLRIGPGGVERNRRSPATYLNDERFGDVAVPPHVDAAADPEWVRVAAEPRWLWHDHRAHWMSPEPPAFVEVGPVARALMRAGLVGPVGRAGGEVFASWAIPFRHGGTELVVAGELAWEPPPPAWPWLVTALALAAPLAALASRRRADRALRLAAWVVLAVAALGVAQLTDDVLAWPQPLLDDLFGLLHTSLFLGLGLGGALWALRGRQGRRLALGVASGAVLYHQGLVHLPMLLTSQFPTVWPPGLVRLTVALGLVQALPVAAAMLASRRATGPPPAGPSPGGRPGDEVAGYVAHPPQEARPAAAARPAGDRR